MQIKNYLYFSNLGCVLKWIGFALLVRRKTKQEKSFFSRLRENEPSLLYIY